MLATFNVLNLFKPGRLLIALQVVMIAWLATLLIVKGVVRQQQLQTEIANQIQDNEELDRRNQRMLSQVEALRSDDELVVEERARKDLGMVKDKETFFIFVD